MAKAKAAKKTTAKAEPKAKAAPAPKAPVKKVAPAAKPAPAPKAAPAPKPAPAPVPKAAPAKPSKVISMQEKYHMIDEAAYYRAEKCGFQVDPGGNWEAAEKEIDELLAKQNIVVQG